MPPEDATTQEVRVEAPATHEAPRTTLESARDRFNSIATNLGSALHRLQRENPSVDLTTEVQQFATQQTELDALTPETTIKQTETPAATEKSESLPKKELQTVSLIEDIALARTEIENSIFRKGLPPDKWEAECQRVLEQYPHLQKYRRIFDNAINRALETHSKIQEIFASFELGQEPSGANQPMGQVNPEVSKQVFHSLFFMEPETEITAIKEPTTIRFMLHKIDYINLLRKENQASLIQSNAPGFVIDRRDIKVIVLNTDNMERGVARVVPHEQEHAKNAIFFVARGRFALKRPSLDEITEDPSYESLRKQLYKEWLVPGAEDRAKDEMLAFFTALEYTNDSNQETLDKTSQEYLSNVRRQVAQSGGAYFNMYMGQYHYMEYPEQQRLYLQNASKAFDTMIGLEDFYRKTGIGNSVRLTINILEQFPLRKWPAVARLIEMRHRKAAAQTAA